MFEALTDRFETIFDRLKGRGKLREADVDEALREIRRALLEADVNLLVVKSMVGRIRERAVGSEVSEALNPGQQMVKIVHEELVASLGGETIRITFAPRPPTVVLMAGLQGSGKTTNSAKLAKWFRAQGRNPLLVGADLQRPAAVHQLRTLAGQVNVPVFSAPDDVVASGVGDPVEVARGAVAEARRLGRDVLICDTAGRLAIDSELMAQVRDISAEIQPDYTFLVVDAMTGQDAVTVAESFNDSLDLDGVILTKLDGDARGGAALSVKEVVGKPIAFASTGEKLDDFDLFHPDRLAGRILGMGDVLTLIEQAEQAFEEEQAEAAAAKLSEGTFSFDDFLEQMQAVKKMGSLNKMIGMLPGVPKEVRDVEIDDRELARVEGMIHSMTREERADPSIIDGSRRARIAAGSGMEPGQVGQLVNQFDEMRKMMKSMPGLAAGMERKKSKASKKRKGKKGGRTTPKKTKVGAGGGGFTLPGLDG